MARKPIHSAQLRQPDRRRKSRDRGGTEGGVLYWSGCVHQSNDPPPKCGTLWLVLLHERCDYHYVLRSAFLSMICPCLVFCFTFWSLFPHCNEEIHMYAHTYVLIKGVKSERNFISQYCSRLHAVRSGRKGENFCPVISVGAES